MIIDTHAHYDDDKFNEDRDEIINSLKEEGIDIVVNIGASLDSCKKTIELTAKYPFIYGALGVHPSDIGDLNEESFKWLSEAVDREKIVAVGEIGLDYYWCDDRDEQKRQREWFVRQINLAREKNLPIVVHSRDAAKDTLDIVKAQRAGEIGGIIHCFSYGKEMAKEYLDMDFFLGIGGVVTFNNAKKIKEVVEYTPIEKIVLETDCPYLAPVPFRGKRNSSLYLPYVVKEIANIKKISEQEVIDITRKNALTVYRINK
ncbi:MAG: TatD family deoxyribonuclease [Lachnospiraceae bacterium]|nr:TatD family deoxyribonuclease [Lachnospiraceae bacterium]